jgi:hypothetical protein
MGDAIGHSNIAVQPGALYRHFKGGMYVVFALLDPSGSDKRHMVAHMNLETGVKYWRPYSGEDGFTTPKITDDGKEIQRFTFCGYAEEIKIDQRGRYYITHKY